MSTQVDAKRLIFPGLAGIYELGAPYSYSFMRFATGAILVPHGVQKVFFGSLDTYTKMIGGKGCRWPRCSPV